MKHAYRTARNAEIVARQWGKSLEDKGWFDISGQDEEVAEIRIYDVIGWPFIDADMFLSELAGVTASTVRLRINSPGGDVFDGTAIFNAIKEHQATFNAEINGVAASMASLIALACDTVSIADNAWYMIHNPWTWMAGDYQDLRKEADLLERMAEVMAKTYVDKTDDDLKAIRKMMDDETWFVGEEAVTAGFADSVSGENSATAKFNTSIFGNAPEDIQRAAHNINPGKREAERSLRDAGFSRSHAKSIVNKGFNDQRDAGNDQRDADDEATQVEFLNRTIAAIS